MDEAKLGPERPAATPPTPSSAGGGIVWLASYPKSGNTWFRAFITNLLRERDVPADINDLLTDTIADGRSTFDDAVGFPSGALTMEEIDRLRPEVYLHYSRTAEEVHFSKVHDAYTYLPDGRPLFPPAATRAVIYLIRNPLDVCVSYAHHQQEDGYENRIRFMRDPAACLAGSAPTGLQQLRQRLLTWSGHVLSWVQAPGIRVHVVRYEDLKAAPAETFGEAVRFLGLPDEPERLARAIHFSRFEELRRQEEEGGFLERVAASKTFFREGAVGSGRERLSADQIRTLILDHGEVMRRFGYLNDHGDLSN